MKKNKGKIQIGIIGSMADKDLTESTKKLAIEIGQNIALNKAVLLFGFEDDFESVSSIAAKEAEKLGGETIAFIRGSKKQNLRGLHSTQVVTGQDRGGGREFSLILSCDAIICLNGGSGTLMEITMAYQNSIPLITVKDSGGWSQKLEGKFIDERQKLKILVANSCKQAVELAIDKAKK